MVERMREMKVFFLFSGSLCIFFDYLSILANLCFLALVTCL